MVGGDDEERDVAFQQVRDRAPQRRGALQDRRGALLRSPPIAGGRAEQGSACSSGGGLCRRSHLGWSGADQRRRPAGA
jgi:hypothetical protein